MHSVFGYTSLLLFLFLGAVMPGEAAPAVGQSEVHRAFSQSLSSKGAQYSRQMARVHRLLWRSWQRRQRTVVDVTLFGIDAGAIYTIHIRPDEAGRWVVTEYVRHFQAPEREPEPRHLVASGVALRPYRFRGGAFAVRLVTQRGMNLPLFEYIK